MRLLGASESDHRSIDSIAKVLEQRGRDRFAYQRLVWYHAQKIIADQQIWDAVSDVAQELWNEGVADLEMDTDTPGKHWAFLDPKIVYTLCRRAGLKRGMLNAA